MCSLLATPRIAQTIKQLDRTANDLAQAVSRATLDSTSLTIKQARHALQLLDSFKRKTVERKLLRRLHQRLLNPEEKTAITRLTTETKGNGIHKMPEVGRNPPESQNFQRIGMEAHQDPNQKQTKDTSPRHRQRVQL